jgi:hypothetical protein
MHRVNLSEAFPPPEMHWVNLSEAFPPPE